MSSTIAIAQRVQECWQKEWPDTADWLRRWWGVWLVTAVYTFSSDLAAPAVQGFGWPAVLTVLGAFTAWLFTTVRSPHIAPGLARLGWVRPASRSHWALGLIGGMVLAGAVAIFTTTLGLPLVSSAPVHQRIIAVTIGPVAEELLFRGALQPWLAMRLRSEWTAVTVASALFAAVHWPWAAVKAVCVVVAGVVYGTVRVYCRSSAVATLGHVTYNLTMLALVVISDKWA